MLLGDGEAFYLGSRWESQGRYLGQSITGRTPLTFSWAFRAKKRMGADIAYGRPGCGPTTFRLSNEEGRSVWGNQQVFPTSVRVKRSFESVGCGIHRVPTSDWDNWERFRPQLCSLIIKPTSSMWAASLDTRNIGCRCVWPQRSHRDHLSRFRPHEGQLLAPKILIPLQGFMTWGIARDFSYFFDFENKSVIGYLLLMLFYPEKLSIRMVALCWKSRLKISEGEISRPLSLCLLCVTMKALWKLKKLFFYVTRYGCLNSQELCGQCL